MDEIRRIPADELVRSTSRDHPIWSNKQYHHSEIKLLEDWRRALEFNIEDYIDRVLMKYALLLIIEADSDE